MAAATAASLFGRRGALINDGSRIGFGSHSHKLGDTVAFGVVTLNARGEGAVHIRDARITGVPDGLQIVAVHAVKAGESPLIGALREPPERDPRIHLHPLSDIRVVPGAQARLWYLLVVARIIKPGTWRTRGIEVSWKRGIWRGRTHFHHYIEVTTEHELFN